MRAVWAVGHDFKWQTITEGARSEVKIPVSSLSGDALRSIIEAFVLREGTDYGPAEHGLEGKCRAVLRQIEAGEAIINFDPETETTDIRPADE